MVRPLIELVRDAAKSGIAMCGSNELRGVDNAANGGGVSVCPDSPDGPECPECPECAVPVLPVPLNVPNVDECLRSTEGAGDGVNDFRP